MPGSVTPMIHVPDVRATVEWYRGIGFEVVGVNEPDGEMDWAALTFGAGRIMFNEGGRPSGAHRREVDLYLDVEDVDALADRLKTKGVEIVEDVHDTFYGQRELIVRDLNRFWITFGQPIGDR